MAQSRFLFTTPGLHQNAINMWKYFPGFIKAAFQAAFNQESLLNARGRLLDQDWFHILMLLKSSIVQWIAMWRRNFADRKDNTAKKKT
ncbi:MAG: hypothetical protein IJ728_11625 [Selenomonadaceae bacterium]|nr:hypothetical protein [Selenomonadaceae bacterium]